MYNNYNVFYIETRTAKMSFIPKETQESIATCTEKCVGNVTYYLTIGGIKMVNKIAETTKDTVTWMTDATTRTVPNSVQEINHDCEESDGFVNISVT